MARNRVKISERISRHMLENGLKCKSVKDDNTLYTKFKYTRSRKKLKEIGEKND